MFIQYTTGHAIEPNVIMADLLTQFQTQIPEWTHCLLVKEAPSSEELRVTAWAACSAIQSFDVVDLLRDAGGGNSRSAVLHEHVVLDADADAAAFRRNQQTPRKAGRARW